MGATLCADWVDEDAGSHGATVSGGPVISAAAGATLDTIASEDLPAHAAEIETYLRSELRDAIGDDVREVRGEGLMVGVEVKRDANAAVRDLALEEQVRALPTGRTIIRLLPSLVLSRDDADRAVEAFANIVPDAAQV